MQQVSLPLNLPTICSVSGDKRLLSDSQNIGANMWQQTAVCIHSDQTSETRTRAQLSGGTGPGSWGHGDCEIEISDCDRNLHSPGAEQLSA